MIHVPVAIWAIADTYSIVKMCSVLLLASGNTREYTPSLMWLQKEPSLVLTLEQRKIPISW